MNFKTTIFLIVLLAGAGVWLYFSHAPSATSETPVAQGAKLLDIEAKDVNKVVVSPGNGQRITLEKSGSDWHISQPVKAEADPFQVDPLIRAFTDATTRGQAEVSGANAQASGLSPPKYQVELDTPSKSVTLNVGEKSAIGDNLYVQIKGQSQVQLIPGDASTQVEQNADAYRRKNLITATYDQIKQLSITTPGQKMVMQKVGNDWQMIEPLKMPVDESAARDLIFGITGLRTETLVDATQTPHTGLANPRLSVAFSTGSPTTAPSTSPATQPAWTTIQFGFNDILNKNVYVTVAGSGQVGTMPVSAMDAFNKKPLEIRDKRAVDIDPEHVKRIVMRTNLSATTQPAVRAASSTIVVLDRAKTNTVIGPALPATQAAAKPTSKWLVASSSDAAADDAKVAAMLAVLHPLRADRYLESAPATPPEGKYVLTIILDDGTKEITLMDPGHEQPLAGSYNGLSFETARSLVSNLEGPWTAK